MRTILRVAVILLTLSTLACSPKLRIKPGEIPPAEVPNPTLKVEAEQYVVGHINEGSYNEINLGAGLERVKGVVERLAKAAGYPPNTFPVHLVDAGDEVNAAAVNGASIIVYKKLLERVNSDEELATVLGHEIGHIICKHYKDQEEEESRAEAVGVTSSVLGSIASIAASAAGYGGAADLAGDVTEGTTSLVGYGAFVGSFSRTQEYEADHVGLLVMSKAGYDPQVAPKFWTRANEVFGTTSSTAGAFFSTHPASSDRTKELEKALPLAQAMYQPYESKIEVKPKHSKGKKKQQ